MLKGPQRANALPRDDATTVPRSTGDALAAEHIAHAISTCAGNFEFVCFAHGDADYRPCRLCAVLAGVKPPTCGWYIGAICVDGHAKLPAAVTRARMA